MNQSPPDFATITSLFPNILSNYRFRFEKKGIYLKEGNPTEIIYKEGEKKKNKENEKNK